MRARSLIANCNSIELAIRSLVCIREVYFTTDNAESKSIRNVVVGVVALHREDLTHKGPFQDLIRGVGDIDFLTKGSHDRLLPEKGESNRPVSPLGDCEGPNCT